MSNPLWLAVNCRRSDKEKSPGLWTAHWDKGLCGYREKDLPRDTEGGYLTFFTDNYEKFEEDILRQINRLRRGPDGDKYVGEKTDVRIAADCGSCGKRGAPSPAVRKLIDSFNRAQRQRGAALLAVTPEGDPR